MGLVVKIWMFESSVRMEMTLAASKGRGWTLMFEGRCPF